MLFETLEMERVEFRADARNQRSLAAMQGIGCTLEGILRNNCTASTGRRDSAVFKYNEGRMGSWAQAKPLGQKCIKPDNARRDLNSSPVLKFPRQNCGNANQRCSLKLH